jgi:hypothetical protein
MRKTKVDRTLQPLEEAFLRGLVEPNGLYGRSRIANYMGTCRPPTTAEGLTTGGGFASGAMNFNMWQGSVDVTIKTVDHSDRYWSLSGNWGTPWGVYTLVPR